MTPENLACCHFGVNVRILRFRAAAFSSVLVKYNFKLLCAPVIAFKTKRKTNVVRLTLSFLETTSSLHSFVPFDFMCDYDARSCTGGNPDVPTGVTRDFQPGPSVLGL